MAVVGAAIVGAMLPTASAWVVSTLGSLLASAAMTVLSRALMDQPSQEKPGIKTDVTTAGESTPQNLILGTYATAGNMVAPPMTAGRAGGAPNGFLTYVIDVSDIRVQGMAGLWINDERVTLGPPDPMGANFPGHQPVTSGKYAGQAWVQFFDGTQTVAQTGHLALAGGAPERPWTEDMIGYGIAYAIVRFRFNPEVYSGLPGVLFEVDGIKLYDPRQDSSVGGSGPQRWGSRGTWTHTRNPAVMIYNILRGINLLDGPGRSLPAVGGTVWGGEAQAADLPLANWFAAMNECDRVVGGQPQYEAGYDVRIGPASMGGMEPAAVIESLLRVCSGQVSEFGGTWRMRAGPVGMPVAVFTDDDIIITEGQQFEPFPGLSETYNAVHAQYPEPGERWGSKEAPPRYTPAYEAQDDNRRLVASLNLDACPDGKQAQRLMLAYAKDGRRARYHDLTLPPDYSQVEVLDAVAWSSDRNGYISKVGEITSTSSGSRSLLHRIGWRERDPADYDWEPGFELPTTINPVTHYPIAAQSVPGWFVSATTVKDGSGNDRRPAIVLGWSPDVEDAVGLAYEIRVSGRSELAAAGSTHNFGAGGLIVTEGVLPATQMQARGRLVIPGRATSWTAWTNILTHDVRLGGADIGTIGLPNLDTDLLEWIEANAGTAAGDTQAIIAARDAAIAAANNANTAFGLADQARQDAEAAFAAAEAQTSTAIAKALEAVNAAGAAAGSATTAAGHANDAGTSAGASQASATAAQTSAGQALAYRNAAADSAQTAEGAAASAVISEGVAVNAAIRVLPGDLRDGAKFWTDKAAGPPQTITSVTSGPNLLINADDTITFPSTSSGTITFLNKGALPFKNGRTYRVDAEVRARQAIPRANRFRAAVRLLAGNYGNIIIRLGDDLTPTALDTWQTVSATVAAGNHSTAAWIRVGVQDGLPGDPPADIDVRSIAITDITETLAAAASASAAAASASSAATKATEAGQSASAANTSQTNAATSAANAATSEQAAASSAQTAVDEAGAASNSAAAAVAARIAAESRAVISVPALIAPEYWSGLGVSGLSVDGDNVLTIAASGTGNPFVLPTAGLPYIADHTYKITIRARSTGGVNGVNRIRAYRRIDSETGTQVEASNFGNLSPSVADQWQQVSQTWKAPANAAAATVKLGLNIWGTQTPAFPTEISWIRFEDVTASIESEKFALAAADSASTATTKASDAEQYANAAQSWRNQANTFRGNAETAAIASATAANDAEGFSQQAFQSSLTAARSTGAGVGENPTFTDWPAGVAEPVGYFLWNTDANKKAEKVVYTPTNSVKYKNAIRLTSTTSAPGPTIAFISSMYSHASNNPAQVYVTCEMTRVLGTGSGGYIRVSWIGDNNRSVDYQLMGRGTPGAANTITFAAERPAGFIPGANPEFRLVFTSTSDQIAGQSPAANVFLVHRLDYQEVTNDASVMQWERAKISVEGIASAAYGLRVRAGGATGQLELVALDNPAGAPASAFRVAADQILLAGSVEVGSLAGDLRSTNYEGGENGQGWRILKTGAAEFNTVTIRRQLSIGTGSLAVAGFSTGPTGQWFITDGPITHRVVETEVPISAWSGTKKTYLAVAGMAGATVSTRGSATGTELWGWDAHVIALTQWSGVQRLRIILTFRADRVWQISNHTVNWRLYEVS